MYNSITIGFELRPCIAGTKKKKGLFHRWYEDPHAGIVGIIEYEDGTVAKVTPKNIRFVDSGSKFLGICWGDEEATEENTEEPDIKEEKEEKKVKIAKKG